MFDYKVPLRIYISHILWMVFGLEIIIISGWFNFQEKEIALSGVVILSLSMIRMMIKIEEYIENGDDEIVKRLERRK